jgi:hypothetical protein
MTKDIHRIANVTGFDNGCGAYDFLHTYIDNIDIIDWSQPQYKHFLQLFGQTYQVAPTLENFKKALKAIPGYVNQEYTFGPIARRHMALALGNDDAYRNSETLFNQFITTVEAYITDDNSEGSNESLRRANAEYLKRLKAQYEGQDLDIDAFIKSNNDALLEYFNQQGFDNYIQTLANTNEALMFTVDEINNYARIMRINLEIYNRDDILVSRHDEPRPMFDLKLYNAGIHWRYQAPAHVSVDEVATRNLDTGVSPYDRHPIIQTIYEYGWNQVNIQPFVKRVQDACNDVALSQDFLTQPVVDDYRLLQPDTHLLHWHTAVKSGFKGQATLFKTANEFLNQQLDQGVEYDAAEFNARFDALADAVAFGSSDEMDLLTKPIKIKL